MAVERVNAWTSARSVGDRIRCFRLLVWFLELSLLFLFSEPLFGLKAEVDGSVDWDEEHSAAPDQISY